MKLEAMQNKFFGDMFGKYNDIGKFAKSFWKQLKSLYENENQIKRLSVIHMEMINQNPQKHIVASKKAIADLADLFEHKRKIVIHAKRDFPSSFSRGTKLAKMFHDKIEGILEEWVGDERAIEPESRWLSEAVKRFKVLSEDTPFVSAKVTVPFYIMLSSILLPAYQSLPKLVSEGSMRTTPEFSGILGFLSYFESASDLRGLDN